VSDRRIVASGGAEEGDELADSGLERRCEDGTGMPKISDVDDVDGGCAASCDESRMLGVRRGMASRNPVRRAPGNLDLPQCRGSG